MHQEIEQLKKFPAWFRKLWATSLGIVLALVIGFGAGMLYAEGRIIDDCKFGNVFRVGLQAFNCMRKI